MNAALQCLSHATPLTRYFLSDRFKLDLNIKNPLGTGGKIAFAYESLVKELWMGGKSSTSPTKLKRAIAIFAPQFAGSQQHDSQEFLAFLLGKNLTLSKRVETMVMFIIYFSNLNICLSWPQIQRWAS